MVHRAEVAAAAVNGQPALMSGAPPFPEHRLVTLANWQEPPFNRWAFQHVRELIPTARIRRGSAPVRRLPRRERDLDDLAFRVGGRELTVAEFLDGSFTDGFLVLHDGAVVTERYLNGMAPDTPHLLMSVSKSVTSAVAGALAGRGVLDVATRADDVVPELSATAFAGATVQHLLDMRAGTKFSEDYDDLRAEVRSCEQVYLWRPRDPAGGPDAADALEYFGTLVNDRPHGAPFDYRSILTDVLAWVLERAAGARFHELVARELWRPMGAEFDAEVTLDAHGNPMADGGICATLRDLGRFGQMFLDRGRSGRRHVVPAGWIDDTVRGAPDGLGRYEVTDQARRPARSHYRNYWWVRDPDLPFFHASGIYGQHVFVHVPSRTVVVKLSTWPVAVSEELLGQTVACAEAIAGALAAGPA